MNYKVTEKELIIDESVCTRVLMRDKILDITTFEAGGNLKAYISMVNGKEYIISLKDKNELYKLAELLNN